MRKLIEMLEEYQQFIVVEKGVSFAEESFTQLYEEALKVNAEHLDELDIAGRNGIIIGAVGTGLIGLGTYGISKLVKHRFGKVDTRDEVEEVETDTKLSKRNSYEVWYEEDNGYVDHAVVNAYDPIGAINQFMTTLEDGQEVTITDVNVI